ncbi:hypothetical protein GALMADRAFT_208345 [Galerina marginata CBS 339.88]|uniref:Uncharacterized protein n=1 Tax=Galerina marginata (strain CBS 339.88) TaxID=685588 RepID=A0A067TMI2_GALM3|nr:hypothetical protein GALMADRAFT_208345 [Galerina marginata CBS 339.88]
MSTVKGEGTLLPTCVSDDKRHRRCGDRVKRGGVFSRMDMQQVLKIISPTGVKGEEAGVPYMIIRFGIRTPATVLLPPVFPAVLIPVFIMLQILDDNSGNFQYSGGQWTVSALVQWYKQTSNYPTFVSPSLQSSSPSPLGSFTLEFEGNTPNNVYSQTATVSIDGGAPYTITYSTTIAPPAYLQWYQSPTLADGKHTIVVGQLDGTAVDYALVELGPNTSLDGKTIVVDNDDSALQFSGNWARNTDEFNAGSLPNGFPLHGSTHRSSTPGDSITLMFSGTSTAVYGIFNWANLGLLSATYTLDGNDFHQSYPVTTDTDHFINGDGEALNFVYFSEENLSDGDHTLVIKIIEAQNQVFILDFVTYTASLSRSAVTPPSLPPVATSSSGPSSGAVDGPSGSSGSSTGPGSPSPLTGNSTPPAPLFNSSASKPVSSAQTGPQSFQNATGTTSIGIGSPTSSLSTGSHVQSGFQSPQKAVGRKSVVPIAGGVIGGVILLALFVLLIIYLRKRGSSRGTSNTNSGSQSDNVFPFQDSDLKRERADSSNIPSDRVASPAFINSMNSSFSPTANGASGTRTDPPDQPAGPPAYDALPLYNRSNIPSTTQ